MKNRNQSVKTSTSGESFPAAILTRVGRFVVRGEGKNPLEMPATEVRKEGAVLATGAAAVLAGAAIVITPAAIKKAENVVDKQINVGVQQAQANIDASHSDAAKAIIQANPDRFAGSSDSQEEQAVALSPIAGEGINAVTDVVNESGGDVKLPQAIIDADGTTTDVTKLTNGELQAISAGLQVSDKLVYRVPPQVGEQAAQKIAEESQASPNQ